MEVKSPDIIFPNLGIKFETINEVAFSLFGIEVYWYGILIALGFTIGLILARYLAKRTNQNPEIYADYLIWGMVAAIIGARSYYVFNSWNSYKDNLLEIVRIRDGGLGFYGGLIGAVFALVVFTKVKKLNFLLIADTAAPCVFVGQIFGRIGNFMNKEAFGGYSDSLFAMAVKRTEAKYIPLEFVNNMTIYNGVEYIQVQPMFLYEMMWNFTMLVLILIYFMHKKFDGEIIALYFLFYGVGRAILEPFRTDQLLFAHTGIPISVIVSYVLIISSLVFIIYNRYRIKSMEDS